MSPDCKSGHDDRNGKGGQRQPGPIQSLRQRIQCACRQTASRWCLSPRDHLRALTVGAQSGRHRAQVLQHLLSRLVTRVRPFCQRFHRNAIEFRGNGSINLRWRWWIDMQDLRSNLEQAVAGKRGSARDALIQQSSERKKIAAAINRLSRGLLRRKIKRRAHDRMALCARAIERRGLEVET